MPDDTCVLCYTSGTTGLPKGAILTHRGTLSTVVAANKVLVSNHSQTCQTILVYYVTQVAPQDFPKGTILTHRGTLSTVVAANKVLVSIHSYRHARQARGGTLFLVTCSEVKVNFDTLPVKPCWHDTNYSFFFKCKLMMMRGRTLLYKVMG